MAPLQPKGGHFGLILPLCTSSATVGLALFQYPIFLSFTRDPELKGKPLSHFWEPFIKSGTTLHMATSLVSAASGALAARYLQTHSTLETTDVAQWYTYGAVLAGLRLAFYPVLASSVARMVQAGKKGGNVEETNKTEMQFWLQWHTVRTLLFDIPALWCFGEGVALSFWVGP